MEEKEDLLQIKIDGARLRLSPETRAAIDDINWRLVIWDMGKRFNQDQLENLETETELLLCGLSSPAEYQVELEKRMMLPKEDVISLLNDMDRLIFKKIQEKLEERLARKEKMAKEKNQDVAGPTGENHVPVKLSNLDPRFSKMPLSVQQAISKSNWKETLYIISKKYKTNIEQLGLLENITAKMMTNEISPSKYEESIISEISLPQTTISGLIKDINDNILKKIVGLMKEQDDEKEKAVEEEPPLPPYSTIASADMTTILPDGSEINKNNNEPISKEYKVGESKFVVKPRPKVDESSGETYIPSIVESKMQKPMVSNETLSDYSGTIADNNMAINIDTNKDDTGAPKPHDPYREIVE